MHYIYLEIAYVYTIVVYVIFYHVIVRKTVEILQMPYSFWFWVCLIVPMSHSAGILDFHYIFEIDTKATLSPTSLRIISIYHLDATFFFRKLPSMVLNDSLKWDCVTFMIHFDWCQVRCSCSFLSWFHELSSCERLFWGVVQHRRRHNIPSHFLIAGRSQEMGGRTP
jgi:hypothetical protein